jgi:EAL domain-containing protein (putative c-di-GMP-specific phosphodiesterase class I)
VSANLFELEITESALMADPERALGTLNKISELGVSISVDDFGTGFSSLVYLRQLPIDTLKIDIMFVKNMCANEQDEMIVKSIINMAKNLSLIVVAEGAEDNETLQKLTAMDCDQVQGFYISKPLSGDDFLLFCKNWVSN